MVASGARPLGQRAIANALGWKVLASRFRRDQMPFAEIAIVL